MKHWLGRSLRRKLSFLLIVSMIGPIVLLGYFSYHTASSVSEEKAKLSGMNILRQLDTQFQLMVKDVENLSIFLIGDDDVQRYLSAPQRNVVLRTSIIVFLTNLVFSKDYIADIRIVPDDDKEAIAYSQTPGARQPVAREEAESFAGREDKTWSLAAQLSGASGAGQTMTLSRPIRSTDHYATIGHLTISLNRDALTRSLRRSGMEGGGYVLLLDGQNRVIAGDGPAPGARIEERFPGVRLDKASGGFLNYGDGDGKMTLMVYRMPGVDWTLLGVIPFKQYSSENQHLLRLTAAVVVLEGLILAGIILFLTARITQPLRRLARFLKTGNPEEELPMLPAQTVDEVGQLIMSYNRLSGRIQRLTERVKENEARKKEADLLALQAQIHPHFLYNTLSSIHWLAMANREHRIARMVGALSDFLRFSLNDGEEYCTVGQEAAHAQSYVRIQSDRYPDEWEVRFDIDPDCERGMMLKLLLQPLIENAIRHGVLPKEGKGSIEVSMARDGPWLRVIVQDNGVGMDEEKLERLRASLEREPERSPDKPIGGGYGLRNVHRRLRMHYTGNPGLHLESWEGLGTKAAFTIPIFEVTDDEAHDR
ncbi:cache domain-containing sensor histidine kinase [Cohnella algarum]|uniref:cache domain-containing sensor histidine kinase n=1 Tax=Cohnella algarum TaxID=2044859 RepID=UPI0019680C62|nr:sensor histidine kinase [Cohnella algarum]MBN2982536.1 histidine kinase [Cohnella algarum]